MGVLCRAEENSSRLEGTWVNGLLEGEVKDHGFNQTWTEGYYRDGVPVYGLCQDAQGAQMTSCYSLVEGEDTNQVRALSALWCLLSLYFLLSLFS